VRSLASFACAMHRPTSAWIAIDSITRCARGSRKFPSAAKASPSTALTWMPGLMSISRAMDVPLRMKEGRYV
jgi:hypothetical protein